MGPFFLLMKNYSILFLSIFMLATAPVIVKFLTIAPLAILCWRMFIVVALLFPFAYKDLKLVELRDLKSVVLASSFLLIHFLLWFSGVAKLPIGTTVVIYASNPIFTALIGHLVLKEKFDLKYILSFILSILGIYYAYYSSKDSANNLLGVMQILGAAFFYSAYMVYSKKNRSRLNNGIYNFLLNSFTGILGFITLFTLVFIGGVNIEWIGFASSNWVYLLLLAALPSLMGHTLMVYNVAHFNLNFLSCFKLLAPIFASGLAIILLDERPSVELVTGFILVCAGVMTSLPWKEGFLSKVKIKSK